MTDILECNHRFLVIYHAFDQEFMSVTFGRDYSSFFLHFFNIFGDSSKFTRIISMEARERERESCPTRWY